MRNLVLVAPARSGAGLLAAVLGTAAGWGPSHLSRGQVIDEVDGFSASDRGHTSHRLGPQDATAEVIAAIAAAAADTGDRDVDVAVDWNPRLSMRVGLVAEALPEAQFVLVSRRPVPTISSLMEAWRSQRFASIPDLPDWWGEPWAFPLVEGWREVIGAPPARVCATQWAAITTAILDDLAALPADRWTVASYENLVADPAGEIETVTSALGLSWTGTVPDTLPLTASVVTPPGSGAWRRNLSEVATVLPDVQPVVDRLRSITEEARPGFTWPELEMPADTGPTSTTMASEGTPFSSAHTNSMVQLLQQARASLVITTYKSGHIIVARADEDRLNTEFKSVPRPMGVAVAGRRVAIGVADSILTFTSNPGIAPRVHSHRPVDQAYAPRSIVFTGDIAIHDMGYAGDGTLWFVNTRFSCLCRQDIDYSFVPQWRPAWITGLAAEDRCHLNGLAMVDGVPRYVTALSRTDEAQGWRELKGTSGVVIDVTTNDVVAEGLSMPHSPRWHDGRLWLLESGKGSLATLDVGTGAVTTVATLPGFTRGLSFIGPYALVGLSQVRETVFTSLPITDQSAERNCGVWLVDTRSGDIAGFLKFDGVVQEIFDVQVLDATWPVILDSGDLTVNAFVLPDEALKDVVTPTPGVP